MPALAEIQAHVCRAIIEKDGAAIAPHLAGGPQSVHRLAIYQRHYDATLVNQLVGRFPTVEWLVGSAFMQDAAIQFIRQYPPSSPCLAEYGENFPAFLADLQRDGRAPYLRSVGEVDWSLGQVSVAINRPSIEIAELAVYTPEALLDLRFSIQPGLHHVEANWPVDELVRLHLGNCAPDRYVFEPIDVFLEIRGARGAFRIGRIEQGIFIFRRALAAGLTLGAAVATAQTDCPDFDPSSALISLFSEGLVTHITP